MKASRLKTVIATLLMGPLVAMAHDFTEPFSYFADGHDVKTVLRSFARTQGLSASFDAGIKGRVSGRFKAIAGKDFIQAMGDAYDIGYYVLEDKNIHFFNEKDVKKEQISIPFGSGEAILDSLEQSGLLSDDIPIRVDEFGNVLTLTAPASYIAQIQEAVDTYTAVSAEKIVMRVFPVKHAWADDISISSMDQTVTVPGIATILRGMVMGQSVAGATVSERRGGVESVQALGGPGLSKQKAYQDKKQGSASSTTSPMRMGTISIMADPRVNAVLVSDLAYRMPYYEQVIRDLDKPVELVEIHAAIVDIDTAASRELGVNFRGSHGSSNGEMTSGGSFGAANPSASNSVDTVLNAPGALLSTIYTKGSDFFMARISALESENAARMLGRPSVLTVDNVQALLENTTTYYIPLQGTEAVDLFKVEAGTVLRVTPHIIREEGKTSIKLAVNVQDDQSDSDAGYQNVGNNASGGVTVSPIKQTKISTQAVVEAGQSLLIGGYYYERKSGSDNGVPLLKDIPLLGHLFKWSSKEGRLMERLILITPRIVRPDGMNVPTRVEDSRFARSATQSDYELKTRE